MLPEFPNFKNITIDDKPEIEKITSRFHPYSDYNFTSMWVWDVEEEMQASVLNGNLVIKFRDYITGEPFYSFLGDNQTNETAEQLLGFSVAQNLPPLMKLIPEVTAQSLDPNKYLIVEDRDNFDYIYDISKVKTLDGPKRQKHRETVRALSRKHEYTTEILDLADKSTHQILINLLHQWMENKKKRQGDKWTEDDMDEFQNEYQAIMKLLNAPTDFLQNFYCFAVFIDGELSAFMIDEKLSDDYCISHFGKMNYAHSGNMQLLMQYGADHFSGLGLKYYNDEQDLGLPHLRKSKKSYALNHHLKKFIVTLRD